MKLYEFKFDSWRSKNLIDKTVLEAEEKPKTYKVIYKNVCNKTVKKSDIGNVTGYSNDTVYLLEDNLDKAKELFAKELENKIVISTNKIERLKEDIEKYKNKIDGISKFQECEEE